MIKALKVKVTVLYFVLTSCTILTADAQSDSTARLPNFLLPHFASGVIKFKSGDTKAAVVNYNILDEELVFLQDNNYMVLQDPSVIDTLYIGGSSFVPVKTAFYEVGFTGPALTFYIQHKGYLENVGTTTAYGTRSQSASAQYKKQFYGPAGTVNLSIPENYKVADDSKFWIGRNNKMEKFASKHQFLKIFKDKEKELNKYIDDNNIKFNKIPDLVKLVTYCNELYK